MPNFKYRYLMEDIPFGLLVMKGVAVMAAVPTPTMDKVRRVTQTHPFGLISDPSYSDSDLS